MAFRFIDVVRYGGPDQRTMFAWRHPNEELRPGTVLQVNPGQLAVHFSNGIRVATYVEGKHKVEGNNPAFLSSIKKQFTGGIATDVSSLWFINTAEIPPIKWGTDSRQTVQIVTGTDGRRLTTTVGARGSFTVRPRDHVTVLEEFMTTQPDQVTVELLQQRFREECLHAITDEIGKALVDLGIPFDRINTSKKDLAEHILPLVRDPFERLGISVETFRIDDIHIDAQTQAEIMARQRQREDAYQSGMAEMEGTVGRTEAQRMRAEADLFTRQRGAEADMADADARAHSQKVEGYSYQEKRKFDVLDAAASRDGGTGGSLMDAGMGLTMGLGLGGAMGSVFKEAMSAAGQQGVEPSAEAPVVPAEPAEPVEPVAETPDAPVEPADAAAAVEHKFCPECGTRLNAAAKFCVDCGTKQ